MSSEVIWDGSPQFRQRRYETYEAYLEHQASKLKQIKLANLAIGAFYAHFEINEQPI